MPRNKEDVYRFTSILHLYPKIISIWVCTYLVSFPNRCYKHIPKLVTIGSVALEKKILTDDGSQPIANVKS